MSLKLQQIPINEKSSNDIVRDNRLFSLHKDFKVPQSWSIEELKKDLHFEDLKHNTQKIFDNLVRIFDPDEVANIDDIYDEQYIVDGKHQMSPTVEQTEKMSSMNRTALGIAAKIYLSRYLTAKKNVDVWEGDITFNFWETAGGDTSKINEIAYTGFSEVNTAQDFFNAWEKTPMRNHTGS